MREIARRRPRGGDAPTMVPFLAPAVGGWEQDAACRTLDPTLFFGPNRFEPKRERLAREQAAKAVCARCPALDACRDRALDDAELYGVWGGMAEADRRALLAPTADVARSA